ncbi:c-type cytochrome [Saprospiraceae bacterium]|nr:c-type cytochrome [Saprospiraceae bacterium]MDC3219636.1 c-type cytochrome [Saprospiraceae bacterium]
MSKKYLLSFFLFLFIISCGDDDNEEKYGVMGDLSYIPYSPQAFSITKPDGFPSMFIPTDNSMTLDGIELGKHLFFDPILSADSTMSCSSCHSPSLSFTDGGATSTGIDGISGLRSSMSLLNIGYVEKGLFWDGRSINLEDQALDPVEDPIELHDTWENVEIKLKDHPSYPKKFRMAFGIEDRSEITKELAVKAIAQFERTLIGASSKYDKVIFQGLAAFTDSEDRGMRMFTDAQGGLPDAECAHCHALHLGTTDGFFNNGLDSVGSLKDFIDLGLGGVTQDTFDNGKFRAPTLRNIALTAPYMHDGRFETLEEVVDFYNESPNHNNAANIDVNIRPLGLTSEQKQDLVNFLHTLTDTTFTTKPAFQSPF